jgi:hypothetical protein
MASKTSKSTILQLLPNSVSIKIDGEDVRVATDRHENAIMNMILASQLRSKLQTQMKSYTEDEVKLTPREMRDLAAAARDIASFSAEVYGSTEGIGTEKQEKTVEKDDSMDFSALTVQPIKEDEGTSP